MYIHVKHETVIHVHECRGFESHPRQLIFSRKSDCLGCAVLLYLVCLFVCLGLLASFFLPSHLSLKTCIYMCLFQELNTKAEGKFNRLKAQAKTKITTLNRELERLREEHGAPPLDISAQVCISIALLIRYTRCMICIYRVSFRDPLATAPPPHYF